jgi:hypothetical protein
LQVRKSGYEIKSEQGWLLHEFNLSQILENDVFVVIIFGNQILNSIDLTIPFP